MDSIPYALFLYLISGKMQKSNVTSFGRVALKKLARRLVRKKVKKFAFDHCKTCSERFVIWRDNFSFIFQRKEDKEMSEKSCYTVQELQEILGVSRPTIYNLYAQAIPSLSQAQRIKQLSKEKQLSLKRWKKSCVKLYP